MWREAAPGVSLPSAALLTVLGVPHLVKDRLDLRLQLHLPSPCVHLPGFLLLIRTPVLLDQDPSWFCMTSPCPVTCAGTLIPRKVMP